MRSAALIALIILLLIGVSLAPPVSAACVLNHQSTIRVATLSDKPPPHSSSILHGTTVYFYSNIISGRSFELSAVAGSNCIGQVCNPDFNLVFQKSGSGVFDDQVGPTFNTAGTVTGTIPSGAEWVLIWMRHGPDVPNGDGNIALAEFNFGQIC